jgi:thioester reductase-like protein
MPLFKMEIIPPSRRRNKMNKGFIAGIIVLAVVIGGLVGIKQYEENKQDEQLSLEEAVKAQEAAQKVAEAEEAARKAEELARQQAEEARKAEVLARQEAEAFRAKISSLTAQAQEYLSNNQFQEAISIARGVLREDPQNQTAQTIINAAQGKLEDLARQQAESVTDQVTGTFQPAVSK